MNKRVTSGKMCKKGSGYRQKKSFFLIIYTHTMYLSRFYPFYSWGKGILGTGGEELWIKMTRGAREKRDGGPLCCMTGRAKTQVFV